MNTTLLAAALRAAAYAVAMMIIAMLFAVAVGWAFSQRGQAGSAIHMLMWIGFPILALGGWLIGGDKRIAGSEQPLLAAVIAGGILTVFVWIGTSAGLAAGGIAIAAPLIIIPVALFRSMLGRAGQGTKSRE
jgi:hypothetical membrane protein